MPCLAFTGHKMFCAGPNFWFGPKLYLHLPKEDLHTVKLVFVLALNAIKFLEWLKNLDGHKKFWDL